MLKCLKSWAGVLSVAVYAAVLTCVARYVFPIWDDAGIVLAQKEGVNMLASFPDRPFEGVYASNPSIKIVAQ